MADPFDGIRKFGNEDGELFVSSICQPIQQLAEKCVEIVLMQDHSTIPSLTLLPVKYEYGGTTMRPENHPSCAGH